MPMRFTGPNYTTLGANAAPAADLGRRVPSLGPQFPLTSEVQGRRLPRPAIVGVVAPRRLPEAAHVHSVEGRALKGTCAGERVC